jgi:hypothetical protein
MISPFEKLSGLACPVESKAMLLLVVLSSSAKILAGVLAATLKETSPRR